MSGRIEQIISHSYIHRHSVALFRTGLDCANRVSGKSESQKRGNRAAINTPTNTRIGIASLVATWSVTNSIWISGRMIDSWPPAAPSSIGASGKRMQLHEDVVPSDFPQRK